MKNNNQKTKDNPVKSAQELSLEQLKALAYDLMAEMEQRGAILRQVQLEIQQRQQEK